MGDTCHEVYRDGDTQFWVLLDSRKHMTRKLLSGKQLY
jgi:hypothetical protein